ncbi:MAG: CocE/NonD family hydrolase [Bacteroidota bacterium]
MTMPQRMRLGCSALLVAFALTCSSLIAQEQSYDVKAHYDKSEVMIPMRDGIKLFTIIYSPKDKSSHHPIIITRTAYGIGPYGPTNYRPVIGPNNDFAREGYIVVYQDSRGKFKSEGEFIHHVPYKAKKGPKEFDESSDTYDTIDWLVKHVPNNNGRVGQWGNSWGGWQVSLGMIDAHPALKASNPQAPPQDQFLGDDHHSNGAFQLMYCFSWMMRSGRAREGGPTEQGPPPFRYPMPDGYRFFLELGAMSNADRDYFKGQSPTWNDYAKHGTYDEYWQARNVSRDLKNINHAVLIVLDWFDAQDFWGPNRMYHAMKKYNPNNKTYLVAGPWSHGGHNGRSGDSLGFVGFGSKTSLYFKEKVLLPFFNYYLKNQGSLNLPPVLAFETGGNRWHSLDIWPPPQTEARSLYLLDGGKAAFLPPARSSGDAFDSYVSDPAKPVPYSATITTSEGNLFMVEDQRFVWGRPDVLVYESEVLSKDITIAGSITANLYVSTTGTDGDWVAKLIDVYPDDHPDPSPNPQNVRMGGFQQLLAGDIMRAKFRNSLKDVARLTPVVHPQMGPEVKKLAGVDPMVPNQVTHLEFGLGDKFHTFKKGHRIMVQIQSTWFPMFDRNPQTFVDIYRAVDSEYQKATHKVFRSPSNPSHIKLNVLKR